MAYEDDVRQLYQQRLGREADASGLNYYTNLLQSGLGVNDIVRMLDASPEKMGAAAGGASPMTPSVFPDPFRTGRTGNLGMGSNTGASPQLGSYTPNPYLGQISDDITRRTGLARDQALQGVRGNAIGVGQLGGSRQGVAEAGVINQSLDNLSGQLANLNFQDYTGQQNRNLQQYGMDQGFYTSQRGQDLAQIGLGSQLETQALQNQWYPINQAANIYGTLGGLNSSTTNTASQGGGALGALGGLLGTAQIGSNLKWW